MTRISHFPGNPVSWTSYSARWSSLPSFFVAAHRVFVFVRESQCRFPLVSRWMRSFFTRKFRSTIVSEFSGIALQTSRARVVSPVLYGENRTAASTASAAP